MSANTLLINGKLNPALVNKPAPTVFLDGVTLTTASSPTPVDFVPLVSGSYIIQIVFGVDDPIASTVDKNGAIEWYMWRFDGAYHPVLGSNNTVSGSTLIAPASLATGVGQEAPISPSAYTFQQVVDLVAGTQYLFYIFAYAGTTPNGVWSVPVSVVARLI